MGIGRHADSSSFEPEKLRMTERTFKVVERSAVWRLPGEMALTVWLSSVIVQAGMGSGSNTAHLREVCYAVHRLGVLSAVVAMVGLMLVPWSRRRREWAIAAAGAIMALMVALWDISLAC